MRARSRKQKIRTLIIILLVVVLLAIIWFVRALSQPAEGVVKTVSAPVSSQPKEHLVTVRGKTVTFQYPSGLQPRQANPLTAGEIEKFSFGRHGTLSWNLNIQILRLPSGNLSDDGSYNLRRVHPEQYAEQKLSVNNLPVSIMTDKNAPFGKVAFMTHNGLAAEVALTSGDTLNSDKLQQTLMTVVQSWHWL